MQTLELCDEPLPSYEWLQKNFRSRSAAIRYLSREHKLEVKEIASHLGLPYRHVFGVIAKMKKDVLSEDKCCPVCRRKL